MELKIKERNKNAILTAVKKSKELEDRIKNHATKTNDSRKLLPRERINKLIDQGSFFMEFSIFAGYEVYNTSTPGAGIITGIGIISGLPCIIICNDYNVKGGAYFPLTIKKHLRAQEIAKENKLPCIYIVDSAGAYLPLQAESFADNDHFGKIFYNQANLSAMGIPQIAVVTGMCTAGGAYIPAMADESIMVSNEATIFLAGPALVKAAIREEISALELGGAELHCKKSGLSDHSAESEEKAISIARKIIATLPIKKQTSIDNSDCSDIYRHINSDLKYNYEIHSIINNIIDKDSFLEFKADYGKTLVCGYAAIGAKKIGIIANNGILLSEAALKGCHFVQICNKRAIPIIFLQNITGFMVGKNAEEQGIAKHGAALVNAIATSTTPKITIIIGNSFGAGNYAMCGRAFKPRFIWSWPNSKTAIMGGEQAAEVLAHLHTKNMPYTNPNRKLEIEKIRKQTIIQYELESSCYFTSARLFDDGIIDPKDTRKYIDYALQIIENDQVKNSHGIFRT